MAKQTQLEKDFTFQIKATGLHKLGVELEYRFHPERRWRFDFAWPSAMIAVETEGGVWSAGRHVRPQGFKDDCEKYNAAVELGWKVLRYPADAVADGTAIAQVERILKDGE